MYFLVLEFGSCDLIDCRRMSQVGDTNGREVSDLSAEVNVAVGQVRQVAFDVSAVGQDSSLMVVANKLHLLAIEAKLLGKMVNLCHHVIFSTH